MEDDNNLDLDHSDQSDVASDGFSVDPVEYIDDDIIDSRLSNEDDMMSDDNHHLPEFHSQMRDYLEELRSLGDKSSIVTIPIVTLPGIHLYPGQNYTQTFYNPAVISMLHNIFQNNHTLGVVNEKYYMRSSTVKPKNSIGTTVAIRSCQEEVTNDSPFVKIETEGCRRFRLLEYCGLVDEIIVGKVRYLPELCLQEPGVVAKLQSLNRFQITPPNWNPEKRPCPSSYLPHRSHKYNRFDFATYTPFPAFLYKQYDHQILMSKILRELRSWSNAREIDDFPRSPGEFSYWVSSRLPIDNDQRKILLSIDEVTERLRHVLKLLKENCFICCKGCSNVIAYQKYSFSFSPGTCTFCPICHVLESVITVYNAKGLLLGTTSRYCSVIGYSYVRLQCMQCHSELGCRYTARGKTTKPQTFWALTRESIQTRIIPSE